MLLFAALVILAVCLVAGFTSQHGMQTIIYPGLARKAPSFRAGMDSAEAEGLRWVQSGVACCSMYCRIILIGAPPQDAAKYDGDQRTPFQYRRSRSFRSFLSNRLDTPFRLLTRADTATLGGYSTNK